MKNFLMWYTITIPDDPTPIAMSTDKQMRDFPPNTNELFVLYI
jgi:hypothetical protein